MAVPRIPVVSRGMPREPVGSPVGFPKIREPTGNPVGIQNPANTTQYEMPSTGFAGKPFSENKNVLLYWCLQLLFVMVMLYTASGGSQEKTFC